jgi:hypothetical protein
MSDSEVNAPLVFQCQGCLTIVGDSWSFVGSDEEAKTFTLGGANLSLIPTLPPLTFRFAAASNVSRSVDTESSDGNSFQLLQCDKCAAVVGRVFVATSNPRTDSLRNLFTFDSSKISSYELGKATLVAENAPTADAGGGLAAAASGDADSAKVTVLQKEMVKVQNILLVMDERVSKLEGECPPC